MRLKVDYVSSYFRQEVAELSRALIDREVLSPIEEMERMLWRFASGRWDELVRRRYGPLRRTYGFFESSALLAGEQARRFGM